ncbi:MAG: 23S rRNA (guanosine(2251)-2'-O)-methyltransferase RlmB [Kiritimatiellia bacterium]|jgi:23S rRNA (guanosine2251-2'-O)-methyltransferase
MFTPLALHPALLDRFDGGNDSGGAPRGGFRPRSRGDHDNAGNYRNENVWRSAQANDAARPGRRDDRDRGFPGPRKSGFRKPWERRDDRFGDDRGGFRKPWERRDDDSSDAREGVDGFRKPWEKRDDRFGDDRGGFRKPWERRGSRFGGRDGKFADDRKGGGFRKPWEKRGSRFDDDLDGGFADSREEGGGFRKPWEKRGSRFDDDRDSGFAGPRKGGGGFRKPWERRDDRFGDDHGGFRKPWSTRGSRVDRDRSESGDDAPLPKGAVVPPAPEGELLFGRQPVREMLRANRRVVKMTVLSDGVKDSEEILEIKAACEARGIPIQNHARETIDAWVNAANHQGVMAVCEDYPYAELDEITDAIDVATGDCLVVILDHVVDPQNLGSLLRTCETAGVVGVVIPSDRAVGVTPAAVRASAGAAEHLKIARVPNLVSVIEKFKGLNVWSTGLEALPEARPYTAVDYTGRTCIVIGSEGHGLSSPVRGKCDNLVELPMFGKVSSLNAGVAGAIVLYEAIRQQQQGQQ